MSVAVLVLTRNEEHDIGACLQSVDWASEIVVLDSMSSDRTVEIAGAHGARVYTREFDNYSAQRNFGLRDIAYSADWILMVDADERVPEDLRQEILTATRDAADDVTLYSMRRRDFLWGKWIRRSGGYPTWFARLARVGKVWVERPINEEYHTSGRSERLTRHLDHFPFSKGFGPWIDKHNKYSSMEASLRAEGGVSDSSLRELRSADPIRRRKALKALAYRLPFRPVLMFLALYVVRGGFLEGRAGITFCALRAWYEFLIDCKYRDLLRAAASRPRP